MTTGNAKGLEAKLHAVLGDMEQITVGCNQTFDNVRILTGRVEHLSALVQDQEVACAQTTFRVKEQANKMDKISENGHAALLSIKQDMRHVRMELDASRLREGEKDQEIRTLSAKVERLDALVRTLVVARAASSQSSPDETPRTNISRQPVQMLPSAQGSLRSTASNNPNQSTRKAPVRAISCRRRHKAFNVEFEDVRHSRQCMLNHLREDTASLMIDACRDGLVKFQRLSFETAGSLRVEAHRTYMCDFTDVRVHMSKNKTEFCKPGQSWTGAKTFLYDLRRLPNVRVTHAKFLSRSSAESIYVLFVDKDS